MELVEIGVISALLAWFITQIHLIRVAKRIKVDIDAKRAETQTFVDSRISKLEAVVGGFEGRMTAQMPPNLHGEIEEVRAEIESINVGLRAEFEGLPARLKQSLAGDETQRNMAMMVAAKELNEGMRGELAAVNAQIPQDMQALDIRSKVLKAISREPTPKERKDMGVVGELVWTAGRAKLAEWLQTEGPPGTSVTYRVSNKSPYGL